MSNTADLEMLEMSLDSGYGWFYVGHYAGGGELALNVSNEPVCEWRAYENDNLEGVQVVISPLDIEHPMAAVIDECRNIEGAVPLVSWDDDYDYSAFNRMLENAYYERT